MTLEAEAGTPRGAAGPERTSTSSRQGMLRGIVGAGLLGIGLSAVLLSYQLLRPAEAEAPRPPAAVDVSRWRDDPGAVVDLPPVTPTPSPVPTPAPTPATPAIDSSPYKLIIDRIGVNAPVVVKGLDADGVPVVPLNGYQVAWYTFSAQPGTGGNAVFAGHVTWGGRAVFYSLNKLSPGDTIRLDSATGASYTYTVTESYTVPENDPVAAVQAMGPTSTDTMTIITCDGEFYYTGDPVLNGSYTARRIIRATLTS